LNHRIFKYFLILVTLIFTSTLHAEPSLKKIGLLPKFSALSDENKTVTDETFKNKYLIVNFFFTSCEGPCPVLMSLVKKLAHDFNTPDLNFISFSVDPETDTVDKLKEYRKKVGLEDSRINLLRTSKDNLTKLLNEDFKLGSGDSPVDHSTRFVLIDKNGTIRALVSGSSPEDLKNLISKLISE